MFGLKRVRVYVILGYWTYALTAYIDGIAGIAPRQRRYGRSPSI